MGTGSKPGPPPWVIAEVDEQRRVVIHAAQSPERTANVAVSVRDARRLAAALLALADQAEGDG